MGAFEITHLAKAMLGLTSGSIEIIGGKAYACEPIPQDVAEDIARTVAQMYASRIALSIAAEERRRGY